MFVDASAIVAMLTGEPESDGFADELDADQTPITSPVAIYEAALGICRKRFRGDADPAALDAAAAGTTGSASREVCS